MTFNFRRILIGVAVAIALILILARIGGSKLSDFSDVSYAMVASSVLFLMFTLVLRAFNFRTIAKQAEPKPIRNWIAVTVRHQFLFSLFPSGLGDIGFPVLARRHVGISISEGTAVIATVRARDLCVLCAMGAMGLAATNYLPWLFAPIGISALAACLVAERLIAPIAALFRRLGRGHFVPAESALVSNRDQLARTALSIASWITAAIALWFAYASAGVILGPPSVCVLIAGLNFVGLIAISIGGLGVAEVGSAGILAFLGFSVDMAARLSLVARPLVLFSVLVACSLLWVILKVTGSGSRIKKALSN